MSDTPFPVDPARTAIAIAYRNPSMSLISDDVLPRLSPIGTKAFRWTEYDLADGFTIPDTKVGRKGEPTEVEFKGAEKHDACEDYGLDDFVPQDDIDQASADGGRFDPLDQATEYVTDLILLDREVRTAGLVFDPATYPAGNKEALVGDDQFSAFDTSAPIEVITDALDSTLVFRPNVMVLGQSVYTKLRQHPHIVKAVLGNSGDKGMATRQQMASLFELEEVLVGASYLNTARKGQAPNLQRVWGKHMALIHRNRAATNRNGVTFGYTAQYRTRIAGVMPEGKKGLRGGQRVRVGETVKEVIAAAAVGYFIEDAVA